MVIARPVRAACAAFVAAAALSACGPSEPAIDDTERGGTDVPARPLEGSLAWSVAGDWRSEAHRGLDGSRAPEAVVEFLRIAPSDVVIDMWPDTGWWTEILAPHLAQGGGAYVAVHPAPTALDVRARDIESAFFERFGDARVFGQVRQGQFGPRTGPIATEGSADVAFAFEVVHAWMALGLAEKAFADVFAALRPGGYLGVVQARAPAGGVQDPGAMTGYVQQSYVRLLAEEAGFAFIESGEALANPADDADHPFGVWTLAPFRRTSAWGDPPDPAFDLTPYDAVGAPDRMMMLFRKPRS